MTKLLRIATLLGATPLALGTLTYCAWRVTRWEPLMFEGMLLLVVGPISVVAGALVLVVDVRRTWRDGSAPERGRRVRRLLVAALLLANFPAAAFYTFSAIDVYARYTVRVRNQSDRIVESFVVTGPGTSVEIGPIASGERAEAHLHFRGDGTLRFAARQQDRDFTGEIDGYVTTNIGGDKTITIGPHGSVDMREEKSRTR